MKTIAALSALVLTTLLVVLPAWADDLPLMERVYLPSISNQIPPTATPVPPDQEPYFKYASVLRCDPNAGITYAEGTVNIEGQPANGYDVAFSYEDDGPIVAKILSGPHEGYPYWNPGFFSHILGATGPRLGDWHFWIVDENEVRISEIAFFHTDGEANEGSCQQAILKFDTWNPGGTGVLPPHED